MIIEPALPLLSFSILTLLFCGFVVLCLGKVLPGKGSWLIWAGVVFFTTAIGLDAGIFFKEEFRTHVWKSGWIWSREDLGAITVGILQDPIGIGMGSLSALLATALLMNHRLFTQEPRPDKVFAAVAISTAGVALAWNSLTPWLVFAGLVITLVGGFVSLGSRWDSNLDAGIAARFLWERAAGFLLAFSGTCILASSRLALLLNQPEVWASLDGQLESTWIGSILLVTGLFIQMNPFPLLGWIVSDSELSPPIRTLLNQIFPAWAAFSLLVRLEPHFRSLGLFPGFGWFALASCSLTVFTGLFQKHTRLGMGAWLSAGFSMSGALLAFSGPVAGISMLLGVTLSAFCLSIAIAIVPPDCPTTVSNRQRALWIKAAMFLSAAAGTGVFGFISATGGVRWMMEGMNLSGVISFYLFTLAFFVFLRWKLTWNVVGVQNYSDASWLSVFSLFFLIILSLGVVWTGTVSGALVMDHSDQILPSLFAFFFSPEALELPNSGDYISASSLYWGSILLAFMTAFWISGRKKEDQWNILFDVIPRASQFLAQGYKIDLGGQKFGNGIIWMGKWAERIVDEMVWSRWIPRGLFRGVRSVASFASDLDFQLSNGLMGTLRTLVEVPAKVLQLIQMGDVRWYLFFALSSGFALLAHFLKV